MDRDRVAWRGPTLGRALGIFAAFALGLLLLLPLGSSQAAEVKIKVEVGRKGNRILGAIYTHGPDRCAAPRPVRLFIVGEGRARRIDSTRSRLFGSVGGFALSVGRFKFNRSYRVAVPPVTITDNRRRRRCEGDRQIFRTNCPDDAILDPGRPTTDCYVPPTGPAALIGTVRTTLHDNGLTQTVTGTFRLERLRNPRRHLYSWATLAYHTVGGQIHWDQQGTYIPTGCSYTGSGTHPLGPQRPTGPDGEPYWAQVMFELGTRRLAPGARYHVESDGFSYKYVDWGCGDDTPVRLYGGFFDFPGSIYRTQVFRGSAHAALVRAGRVLAGSLTMDSEGHGSGTGLTADLQWSLRPAG